MGYPMIIGKNGPVFSPTSITCTFTLSASARTGLRDVTVTNPEEKKHTLAHGLRVLTWQAPHFSLFSHTLLSPVFSATVYHRAFTGERDYRKKRL
jgi:hypothetical protein